MAHSTSTHRSILSRALATLILIGAYCFSIFVPSALLLRASSTSAFAQGGFGRGGGVVVRGGGFRAKKSSKARSPKTDSLQIKNIPTGPGDDLKARAKK